ncbi:prephenate dehydrogenase (NADP(+)), partial [Tulasnella sp. 417]
LLATPIFRLLIGVAEYLFRDTVWLEAAIHTAAHDPTHRSDDVEYVIAARGRSQCVRFGSFELYERRFKETAKFFEHRFADKLGAQMIKVILEGEETGSGRNYVVFIAGAVDPTTQNLAYSRTRRINKVHIWRIVSDPHPNPAHVFPLLNELCEIVRSSVSSRYVKDLEVWSFDQASPFDHRFKCALFDSLAPSESQNGEGGAPNQ